MNRTYLEAIAPALSPESVQVTLTAAQHLILLRQSIRYRCTVGELMLALSLNALKAFNGDHEDQDRCANESLLRYVVAKLTPDSINCPGLPAVADPSANATEHAAALIRAHYHDAACVRSHLGQTVDFDAVDTEEERMIASLKQEAGA